MIPTSPPEPVRRNALHRDGSTARPTRGAVVLRCYTITLVYPSPSDAIQPNVVRGGRCVLVIERGVEDRDRPAVPAYRAIRMQRLKEPFHAPPAR